MSVRFAGELPIAAGLALAGIAAAAAWWLYHRAPQRSERTRWPLVALRAFAVFATVLTLCQPVLSDRQTFQQPCRIYAFIDTSRSMSISDAHASADKKLLIAQARGWLPPETLDPSLLQAADLLSDARQSTTEARRPGGAVAVLRQGCTEYATQTKAALSALRALTPEKFDAALAGVIKTFDQSVVQKAEELAQKQIDTSTHLAVRSQLNALAQSGADVERQLRELFSAYARRVASAKSEALKPALEKFDGASRVSRAEALALKEIVTPFGAQQRVELIALGAETRMLWRSGSADAPASLGVAAAGKSTDLVEGIQNHLAAELGAPKTSSNEPPAVAVLFSDGRHNAAGDPEQLGKLLAARGVALHTVGIGYDQPPPDLALTGVRHNEIVLQDEMVRGTIFFSDDMPLGLPLTLKIEHDTSVVWQKELKTDGSGSRSALFEFSIAEVNKPAANAPPNPTRAPIEFKTSIVPVAGELRADNNARTLFVVRASSQISRALVLDGRPRWEARYLGNLLARDPRWQVNTLMLMAPADLKIGTGPGTFPDTRAALFDYDLVVAGEIKPGTFTPEQLEWLRDFVRVRGGGLILIDGQRRYLRAYRETSFGEVIPVAWTENAAAFAPVRLELSNTGLAAPALNLGTGETPNTEIWKTLPAPHWAAVVTPLPGSEVWAHAVSKTELTPLLVHRRLGAGSVLYCAFDESWRWRYEVADLYHQRYWNQLANQVMERPFALVTPFVSLDASALVNVAGTRVAIRAKLRSKDGKPIVPEKAEAVFWKDGAAAYTAELKSTGGAALRCVSPALAPGRYELGLRAAGVPEEQLAARLTLLVLPDDDVEMEKLAANPVLLKQMASESGGQFVPEEQAQRLRRLLQSLPTTRVIDTEFKIWQSYWWFLPIVFALALEMLLRKRSGYL